MMADISLPENAQKLSLRLGHIFSDPELLARALRHSSYVNEEGSGLKDNEQLEFLGDSVLDLAVSHLLMEVFFSEAEGELSRLRAMLVGEAGLGRIAEQLELGRYLWLGKGEDRSGGREKSSILADAVEALVGAVYLDAGFDRALEVLRPIFTPFIEQLRTGKTRFDFKTALQEYTQSTFKELPSYRVLSESGPAHDRSYRVGVVLAGRYLAEGTGKTKKEAEQRAAAEALICLKDQ